jgi:hypothetical protein
MYLAPLLFDWAEDINATITPTPITLVTPAARTPCNFSVLHSSNWNPWGSLSHHHHHSHPPMHIVFHSCEYPTKSYHHKPPAPSPSSSPLPPVPVQLVETIQHPCGIAPAKHIVKMTTSVPATSPAHPSIHTPLYMLTSCCTHLDFVSKLLKAHSLDWSGDPFLVGLGTFLEALGWRRPQGFGDMSQQGRCFV